MPPEPLPWDRKDLVLKDRKHDRISAGNALASSAFVGGNNTSRWRDPYHFPPASPRRPPSSFHRQNGSYYQQYDESNGQCTPSRPDDGFRSSNGRYVGGRSSSSRESRGSSRPSPYYDGYLPSHSTSQRSVADPITSPPSLHPPLKGVHDKNGGGADGQRWDQDHPLGSIGWKQLKWCRQGSISSSRTIASDVEEAGNALLDVSVLNLGKETPVRSLVSTTAPLDEGVPKKKPRLTWGQGLAKYEKQKVDGSSNSGKEQVSEASPKCVGMASPMSPVTPCSAACYYPGTEDMPFSKAPNVDNDACHHSESYAMFLINGSEELPNKLDRLSTISTLTDLLQLEDACSGDSTSNRTTATNKLLLFKANVSKELEKTECEIDLLEIELRSLNDKGGNDHSQYSLASQADSFSVSFLESADVSSKVASNLTPIISSATAAAGEPVMPVCPFGEHGSDVKRANIELRQTCFNKGKSTYSGNEEPMPLLVETVVSGNGSGNSSHLYGDNSGASTGSDMYSHEKTDSNFISLIIASNKDAAKRASHVFDGASTTAQQQFDILGSDRMLTCRKNDVHIREKLALLKHQIKFKERVLMLKFRAFHHLWKEDLRLLSVRKQRPKSQKRLDLCSSVSHSSLQKHRFSIRSRFTLPAGNLTLVPTSDIVDFTSRLLSDFQFKRYRKYLKMPALIPDGKERRYSRFITKNNLIEDPLSFEKERSMINLWTQEEKRVFMDTLATVGKDFAKISSFLRHKTTADCIEFYYKNHKSESFRDVKKQLDQRKQVRCLSTSMYLVTSRKKWNCEANAASLDMLGSPSVAVAHNNVTSRNQQKLAARSVVSSIHNLKASRGSCSSLDKVSSVELSGYEKEPACSDALAGVYGALSSEALSSCVTSSVSPPGRMNCLRMERPLTPEVTQTIEEEDTCSDEGSGELNLVDWIDEEKSMFIRALSLYGKNFSRISEFVGTKSSDQCKTFYSKARKCLRLDQIHPVTGNGTPLSDDANGARSDTDDACVADMDSVICSTQSCSRMDVDFTQSLANAGDEVFDYGADTPLLTETDRSSEQFEVDTCYHEEVDGMVDGQESVLEVRKLETEPENAQLKGVEGMDDAALKNSDGVPPHEDAVSTAYTGSGNVYNGISAPHVEPATASCVEGEQLKAPITAKVQLGGGVEAESDAAWVKGEVEFQRIPLVFEAGSRQSRRKIDTNKSNSVKFSLAVESTKEIDSCRAKNMDPCHSGTFNFSTDQHPMHVDLLSCSQKKSHVSSKKQDPIYAVPLSTGFPDPYISTEGSFRVPTQSTLNFKEYLRKLHQGSAGKDVYQQCLSRINLNQIDQSSHVISGFTLPVRNQNIIQENPVFCESHSEGNLGSQLNRYFVGDVYSEKGECSVSSNPMHGMFFFQRNDSTSESLLSACRETDVKSSQRTRDVKLFGQILSNPSSQQKSNSSLQEDALSPKQKKSVYTKMFSSGNAGSSLVFASRSEVIDQSNLEEVPLRSYGYWDGNRIYTGLSSLPDSDIMLGSYQGTAARTPFFPAMDNGVSSTGIPTNFQHSCVKALPANGTCLDSFQELKKRSGFELVSGFQQGGRTAMARLGVNMAGGSRGILVGGSGVSDPVAALKMAKLYTGEVDSWTQDLTGR